VAGLKVAKLVFAPLRPGSFAGCQTTEMTGIKPGKQAAGPAKCIPKNCG
jgi:hypothetical protein